jgi:hypothetical protein
MHSAPGDPDAGEPQVRPTRARARNTPVPALATENPAPRTVRSALDVARERWGTPVGSVTTRGDAPGSPGRHGEAQRDPMAVLRIWTEPSPPMSAVLEDFRDGARQLAPAWLVPYLLFGIPAFAVACAARLLLDAAGRPGRFAALLAVLLLFTAGLYVAGVI